MQWRKSSQEVDYIFKTQDEVRMSDVAYGGHLSSQGLLNLVHNARLNFYASIGTAELIDNEHCLVITDVLIKHRDEAFAKEVLCIEIGATDISPCGFLLHYKFSSKENGRVIAQVTNKIVSVHPTTKKLIQLPESIHQLKLKSL